MDDDSRQTVIDVQGVSVEFPVGQGESFVALQSGRSRACTICAREYFTQDMLIEDERNQQGDANGQESGPRHDGKCKSLARLWYETIDLCPYCGGCLTEQS